MMCRMWIQREKRHREGVAETNRMGERERE